MTPQDFSLGKAVRVLWEDSACADGWQKQVVAEVGKIVTIGWMVDMSEDALAICGTINDQWSGLSPISIPWRSIVAVEEIGDEWNRNGE